MAENRLKEIIKIRLQKIEELRKLGINPYPSRVKGVFEPISSVRDSLDQAKAVVGRIMAWRTHGNVTFADIKDETGKIQLLFQKKVLRDDFKILKFIDMGDFLWATGKVVKTQSGEVTLDVTDFQLLSKSIRPLPSSWHGLKDVEERFRKRYLDLLFNPDVRDRFNKRTIIVRELRKYLDDLGFWEVETPTLQPLYGGANAKPFKTHLNALDVDMYLRIADELYLKRLIVGGYSKVYEICKDFRNEGMDQTHNPEFTMLEFYEAYADYNRVIDVTEGLFKHLAKAVYGETVIEVLDKKIDIGDNWPRVRMIDLFKDKLNLDVDTLSVDELLKYCNDNQVEVVGGETKGQLVYTIFEHKLTGMLIDPTWVLDYPRDVSPLSKQKEENPEWVERFEGYIGGKEICDGWSELTDPVEQRQRFESDVKAAREDKEEAQQVDEDFLEAMEYGMPPIGGIGIGIDRLAMFFTNTWSIKEVMLYPTLRPETRTKKVKRKKR
ncbi:MAG: Lysine-tRNA ligase [Candidatus Woesebacteria bacterium GW2011_GWA1_39_8]|jgi:lysyl-tRNA synthetase class 2|uniref:Lysine--tRNA ligase n=1 Tax=Candidatus Woesebacteria bacterium GW2011_GWA1_39_8 TaxID=1618552 RepID=A0A0G0PPT0_9BACT|nr:MAG: Lysine-tRNA ligase [Candidatus Woesebacteria bacterium GW2011_GWA1_39_8]